MNLPKIAICIVTYNRPDEFRATVSALHHFMHYDGPITWHIADDSSPGSYGSDMRHWMQNLVGWEVTLHKTPSNVGWGANANHCLRGIREQIIVQIEDDYVLQRPINITPYVIMLLENAGVGLVRIDGIAGHRVMAHASEFDISKWMPDYRAGSGSNMGKLFYWRLDVTSRETWLYSNRPHIKHKRFIEHYGPYPEGLKLGATEELYAKQVKLGMTDNAPQIAVPMELALPGFDHIGHSYQHTEFDKGVSIHGA